MGPSRFNLLKVRLADYMARKSELFTIPLILPGKLVDEEYGRDYGVPGADFLILITSTSDQSPVNGLPCFQRVGLGVGFCYEQGKNSADARERLRDRCLEVM